MTEVKNCQSREEVEARALEILKLAIIELLKTKSIINLAVPGGRSVSGIFKLLAKDASIPWEKIHLFMVDERLVSINDPLSNYKLVEDNLVSQIDIPKNNLHPFILGENLEDYGVREYQAELMKNGGKYDIIILSSGEDGHVGALYPNHHSINNESDYYLAMNDSPKPPPKRMTSSLKLLSGAKYAIILFLGEAKKQAYNNYLDKNLSISDCPAKLVDKISNSYLLTDLK